jgi:hypothetical protein
VRDYIPITKLAVNHEDGEQKEVGESPRPSLETHPQLRVVETTRDLENTMLHIIEDGSALMRLLRRHLLTLAMLISIALVSNFQTTAVQADTLPDVSIAVADPVAAESGLKSASFIVTRTGTTTASLNAEYTVIGAATAGKDYVALEGSVTIPVGAASATLIITPIDDTIAEGTETVVVLLSANSAYRVVASGSATAVMADDDTTSQIVCFAVDDPGAAESGVSAGRFTVMRGGSTAAPLTVGYTVDGTATAGKDYVPLAGSVTIPAGQASAVIALTPIDDRVVEETEIVVLMLRSNASYRRETPASATVTIDDNDTGSSPPSGSAPTPKPGLGVYMPLVNNGP